MRYPEKTGVMKSPELVADDLVFSDKRIDAMLPSPYVHSAWWPWVKNYGGELRGAGERAAPIYARIWIDQALKKKMGY